MGESRGLVAGPVPCPYFEGQTVRTAVGVALVTVCLGLAGCSLFGKKHAAQTKDNPKPFLGSDKPAKAETVAVPRENGGTLPGANGVLAGRVIVEATDRPIRAYIQIRDRDHEDGKAAELDVPTNESGYFYIPNLKVGDTYELIARAKENDELISYTAWVRPPNPILLLKLDKKYTMASTPKLPDMPNTPPDKKSAPNPSKESVHDAKPAVSIDPPVKLSEDAPQPRRGIATPPVQDSGGSSGGSSPNPANIAENEFRRTTQPSVPVDIPNKPSWPPPVPGGGQWEGIPEQRQPSQPPSGAPGSVQLPNISTHVPSCGIYGDRLSNFALYDLDGKVWEYKRNHHGRLLLLDFWHTQCTRCYLEFPHLVELNKRYGPYGLEIVSIACETGPVEQQRSRVRSFRGRYNINYTTLLSGGGPEKCPVMNEFQVTYYPCLILIDGDGTIIWRSTKENGMDDNAHYVLMKKIDERLVTRQQMP